MSTDAEGPEDEVAMLRQHKAQARLFAARVRAHLAGAPQFLDCVSVPRSTMESLLSVIESLAHE